MESNTVHLIGINHGPKSNYLELQRSLALKACDEELVLGIEGHPRDDRYEQSFVKEYCQRDSGLVFGIEDEIPLAISNIVSRYFILTAKGVDDAHQTRQLVAKMQLFKDLIDLPIMSKLFSSVEPKLESKNTKDLYRGVVGAVYYINSTGLHLSYTQGLIDPVKGKYPFTDDYAWNDFCKKLGYETVSVVNSMTPEQQPVLTTSLEDFFRSAPSFDDQTMIFEMASWRDNPLADNMGWVIARGNEKSLDTYFLVGSSHTDSLSKRIKTYCNGLNFKMTSDEEGVPQEYGYLLNN